MTQANVRQLKRRAAKAPAPRTVTVSIKDGEFEGWEATAKADFSARLLVDLQSGDMAKLVAVMDKIVIDHNMPDADGNVAGSLIDVVPFLGVVEIGSEIFDALAKLPNR